MSAGRVVVVGSLNEDLTLTVERAPQPGETVLASAVSTGCGGKGANQAVAAVRAGAAVRMVGCVGSDAAGRQLRDRLQEEGIDIGGVIEVEEPTGLAVVTVAADGENSIIVVPGANYALGPATVRAGLASLRPSDVVVAQAEISAESIVAVGARAASAGARFVLNLAPPVPLDLGSIRLAALVVNEHEAASLAAPDTPERMAGALAEVHATTVVVTLGGAGVVVADGARTVRLPAYRPARIVDTTGAGDSFVGAFAAALAGGLPVEDAVRWGAAAGSLAVAAVGAQGARPTAEAIAAVIAAATSDGRLG